MHELRFLLAPPTALPPALALLSLLWAFVFGACVGSFLNVVIARVPAGLSVVVPRSRCPKCHKQISGFDNIPLLSWLLLRGKCRSCALPISGRYPFIEALMGLAAMAIVARHGYGLHALELFTFTAILVAIAFVDMDTWTVPHSLWIALVVTGLGFGLSHALTARGDLSLWPALVGRLMGAAGAGLCLSALVVVSTGVLRRMGRISGDQMAMGWGDPLILVGVGAFLGWRLLPFVLFFASLQGSVVALVLRWRGELQGDKPVSANDTWIPPKGAVPFGPFLALGALEAAFFADAIREHFSFLLGRVVEVSQQIY